MFIDSFEWMIAITLLSIPILFIIFKLTNEVIISADIRPASMQIIFVLIVTPIVSLIVFASSESWENVKSYETLVANEQKAYPELFASYQTLLDSIDNSNNDNKNEIKNIEYKKLDNFRNAIVNYQHVYMEKNYTFSAFYPNLTAIIDQIEMDIMNSHFKEAKIKLKDSHEQLLRVRNVYLDELKDGKAFTETKLWLLVGMLAFFSVFLLAWGILLALIVLYTDKILIDINLKLLKLEPKLNVSDKKIYLKIRYILSKKYLFYRAFRLFLILPKVYKLIENNSRLHCLEGF